MDIKALREKLNQENPEYVLVERTTHQTLDGDSYKKLYESNIEQIAFLKDENQRVLQENKELNSKLKDAVFQKPEIDGELIYLKKIYDALIIDKNDLNSIEATDLDGDKEETLGDSMVVKEDKLATRPAIYNFNRPSFIALANLKEFDKKNVTEKVKNNTKSDLLRWLKLRKELNNKTPEEAAYIYDERRKAAIYDICNNKAYSNGEKYIKYMVLNPGIDQAFIQMLDRAAELGLDAKIVISLLEQPNGVFNREIVSLYVNNVYKGNEYNLKQELAEELIKGNWYLTAKNSENKKIKYAVVPFEELKELKARIGEILQQQSNKNKQNNSDGDE